MRLLRTSLAAAVALSIVWIAAAATPKKKSSAGKTTEKGSASAKKQVAAKKPAKSAKKAASPRKRAAKRRPARPRGQLHPTSERYREIEQALASRGYFKEEPTGKWGPSAVEALKSFQADNELPATGKLDALSLIELGLGPSQ